MNIEVKNSIKPIDYNDAIEELEESDYSEYDMDKANFQKCMNEGGALLGMLKEICILYLIALFHGAKIVLIFIVF